MALKNKNKQALPQLHVVKWLRGKGTPDTYIESAYRKAKTWASTGEIETGKSTLLTVIASNIAMQHGSSILDLFGSRDNEGLAWLRSPFGKKVLLLKGQSVEVECQHEVKNALDFHLSDFNKYKVIISASSMYGTIQEEWYSIGKLVEKLWQRTSWDYPDVIICREFSSLGYSRHKLGDTQEQAKAYLAYMAREIRHCGFHLCFDTIRMMGVDINFRTLVDYLFLKGQGKEGLKPQGLGWVYRYVDPVGLQLMPPELSVLACKRYALGIIKHDMPYWHKLEHENMLELFGIKTSYKQLPYLGERGYQRVSDPEHARIVKLRVEKKGKRKGKALSMGDIAKLLGRSPKTIEDQLKLHNNYVHSVGQCDRCSVINAPYSKQAC